MKIPSRINHWKIKMLTGNDYQQKFDQKKMFRVRMSDQMTVIFAPR